MTDAIANERIVHRLFEAFDAADDEVIDEILAEDFTMHTAAPGYSRDADGLKTLVTNWRNAVRDWHRTLEEVVGSGELVVVRFTGKGTYQNRLSGVPAIDGVVLMTGREEYRVVEGKVTDCWGEYSMSQLSEPAASGAVGEAAQ